MKKLFLLLALAVGLSSSPALAQVKISNLPTATVVNGTDIIPTTQGIVTRGATPEQIRAFAAKTKQGMINVRTIYGAIPDGSTDNSTAITNAFTAANAYATGSAPTVYFDCDTSSTTCVYNYGGSGTSPINPTKAMNIQCAQGVTLNYTGTAHAADIGATGLGLSTQISKRLSIQGCRWTGGGSSTAGLYFNNYVTTYQIHNNEFISFGQANTFSIVLSGNNWDGDISNNVWHDLDGVVRGVLDAHTAPNANIHFVNNKADCLTSGGLGCPIPTAGNGVGLWIANGYVAFNQILAHYPAIRLSSCAACGGGTGPFIAFNTIEGNTGGTSPAITYGDPGGPGNVHIVGWHINSNAFYWPTTGNVSTIGPETPASALYYLDSSEFIGNLFAGAPNSTTPYINTNGSAAGSYYYNNTTTGGGEITQSNTNPLFDTAHGGVASSVISAKKGSGTSIANVIPVGDSTGTRVSAALFHNFASPLLCADISASGTAQTCNTSPRFDTTGTQVTAVAGDMILYKTTTTNTGALTIAVNSGTAAPVYKPSTNSAVAAGDVIAGIYHLLTFNGTNWYMVGR